MGELDNRPTFSIIFVFATQLVHSISRFRKTNGNMIITIVPAIIYHIITNNLIVIDTILLLDVNLLKSTPHSTFRVKLNRTHDLEQSTI